MNRSHEFARILLQRARDDRYVASRLADDPDAPDWSIGFHTQQATEKALKAVLSFRSIEYPRTRNLSLLIDLLRENSLSTPPDTSELPRLTPFGATLRYDAALEAETPFDRTWAKRCVNRTISWAESLIVKSEG